MNSVRRDRRKKGKFYTPQPVVDFCWRVLHAWIGPEQLREFFVVDPAAGDGIFLRAGIEAGWIDPSRTLGVELYPESGTAADFSMIYGNGLLDRADRGFEGGRFDLVIGNPPYGGEGIRGILKDEKIRAELMSHYTAWKGGSPAAVWREDQASGRLATCPVELLFVERFLMLCKEGGWCVIVLPEGVLANERSRRLRQSLEQQASVKAVISLPSELFRGAGAAARTAILMLQKSSSQSEPAYLSSPAFWPERSGLAAYLDEVEKELLDVKSTGKGVRLHLEEPTARRWDPGYWNPQFRRDRLPDERTVPLGQFIESITYGPILPGRRPSPVEGGIRLIGQKQFTGAGLDLSHAVRVETGSLFDPEKSRVYQDDLLMPRSGEGSLLRFKVGVYRDSEPANVSCFVDRIRLSGMDPYFVWLVLKTRFLRSQILQLQNGVGTPNISFGEIRSLRIPWFDLDEQHRWRAAYFERVAPLQDRRVKETDPERKTRWGREADRAFGDLVETLERQIEDEFKKIPYPKDSPT